MSPAETITNDISDRICKHMNAEHLEALISYAVHYGGIKEASAVKMLSMTSEAMELEVDGSKIKIAFDHRLVDSEDAHRTLVSMLKKKSI